MHSIASTTVWIVFSLFVIIALSVDTLLVEKKHSLGPNTSLHAALYWTIWWVLCALIFALIFWYYLHQTVGPLVAKKQTLDFLTGYLIEKSLSIDNLFTFYMIFHQFQIPAKYQHRVFAYGIWSAIIFRLILILFGTILVTKYHWILYVFGVFLVLTGIKMFFFSKEEKDLTHGPIFNFLKSHFRITNEIHEQHFFICKNFQWYATRLFVALIFIEISDIIFAFDSIPAIFAITQDPFIVWTSNIFAILGLRALYFFLAGVADRFQLLKYGIALILVFVGMKMLIEPWFHITTVISLTVVASVLVLFVLISFYYSAKDTSINKGK